MRYAEHLDSGCWWTPMMLVDLCSHFLSVELWEGMCCALRANDGQQLYVLSSTASPIPLSYLIGIEYCLCHLPLSHPLLLFLHVALYLADLSNIMPSHLNIDRNNPTFAQLSQIPWTLSSIRNVCFFPLSRNIRYSSLSLLSTTHSMCRSRVFSVVLLTSASECKHSGGFSSSSSLSLSLYLPPPLSIVSCI